MTKIADRLKFLIEQTFTSHKRFKDLEDITSISADSWRMVCSGKQRATEEMIEMICKEWPQYALWLTTGIVNSLNVQVVPPNIDAIANDGSSSVDKLLSGDPEKLKTKSLNELEQHLSTSISTFIQGEVDATINNFVFDEQTVHKLTGQKGVAKFFVEVKSRKPK